MDLISAAYFEVGKLDDAAEANKLAEGMDRAPNEKVRCTRLLRGVADSTGSSRDEAFEELRLVASVPPTDTRSAHCRAEYEAMRCSQDGQCSTYWSMLVPAADSPGVEVLANVYRSWPTLRSTTDWQFAASRLSVAWPLRDRFRLMIPAVEVALRLSRCQGGSVFDFEKSIEKGLADLSSSTKASSPTNWNIEEREHAVELSMLSRDEVTDWHARLSTALRHSKHLWKLDASTCSKYGGALPPAQP